MQEVGGSKPLGVTKKHPEIFPDAFSIESGIQIYRSDERVAEHAVYVVYNDEGILVVLFDQPFKSDQLGFVDDNIEDILLRPCIETFAVKHCHTTADFTVDQCTERSEEHTSELQSRFDLVCRLLLEKKNNR